MKLRWPPAGPAAAAARPRRRHRPRPSPSPRSGAPGRGGPACRGTRGIAPAAGPAWPGPPDARAGSPDDTGDDRPGSRPRPRPARRAGRHRPGPRLRPARPGDRHRPGGHEARPRAPPPGDPARPRLEAGLARRRTRRRGQRIGSSGGPPASTVAPRTCGDSSSPAVRSAWPMAGPTSSSWSTRPPRPGWPPAWRRRGCRPRGASAAAAAS